MKKIFTKYYLLGLLFFVLSKIELYYENSLSSTFLSVVAIVFFMLDLVEKLKNRRKE
jgi:hypothetical protein